MGIQASRRGRVLGVIPARMESQRLPGKPLRPICGHPMIAWVYSRARQSQHLDRLLVATDAEEVVVYCQSANIPVELTSRSHRSGTDRIVEVLASEPADIAVNIQGDEPMITAEHLELLLRPFAEDAETQLATLMVPISRDQASDPNVVKVVRGARHQALYFSRAPIPHDRDGSGAPYYKHLGLYAYAALALKKFSRLPPSLLESVEKLEQLRFLENGIPITVVETTQDTIAVDTEADLQKVETYFRSVGAQLPTEQRLR